MTFFAWLHSSRKTSKAASTVIVTPVTASNTRQARGLANIGASQRAPSQRGAGGCG